MERGKENREPRTENRRKKSEDKKGKKLKPVPDKMFISNVWMPIEMGRSQDTDYSLRSAFCFKDRIQWFYLTKAQKGFTEFEPVHCEFCKGDLYRDENFGSGFSASDIPEVIAWLQEHPTKNKTLILVFIQSSLEQVKNSLLSHLKKQDFSGMYTALEVMDAGLLSSQTLKQYFKKKNFSSITLLNTIDILKPSVRRKDKSTLINTMVSEALINEKEYIKESKQSQLQRQKFSESAKDALKIFQSVSILGNNFQSYKKFKKNQKLFGLLSRPMNLTKELKSLKPKQRHSINSLLLKFQLRHLSPADLIHTQEDKDLSMSKRQEEKLAKKREANQSMKYLKKKKANGRKDKKNRASMFSRSQ